MKHFILPDVQAKDGHSFEFLTKAGQYVLDKRPEKLICLGDFADMPSLSSYDKGTKSFEGRRYTKDISAAHSAMAAFLAPINLHNERAKKNGKKQYKPEMHLFLGNHEERINKVVNLDPKLEGMLSIKDLRYEDFGWKVYPFLEVGIIDGVAYSHYFTSGLLGRPVTTASACLSKKHMSCIQGHQQGLQIASATRADGKMITSIIAGSFYEHDEEYMGPQQNNHWRGCLMLHEVDDGHFDIMPLSLKYLQNR